MDMAGWDRICWGVRLMIGMADSFEKYGYLLNHIPFAVFLVVSPAACGERPFIDVPNFSILV